MRVLLRSTNSDIKTSFSPVIRFVSFIVGNICIPYTFYNIIENTRISWTSVLGSFEQLLGAGQYTIMELLQEITIAMENLDASLSITWLIRPGTNIIDIVNNNNFTWDCSDADSLASTYLGFAPIVYTGNNTYGGAQAYHIRRTCSINIQSNLFSGKKSYDNIDNPKKADSRRRILDSIVFNDKNYSFSDVIQKNEINGLFYPSVSKMMNNIEMFLIDDNGDKIDLNGYEWSIELIFLSESDIIDIKKITDTETYKYIVQK